jgi:predicted AlkP superfamily pyrophosphatase or phosphodiesterase
MKNTFLISLLFLCFGVTAQKSKNSNKLDQPKLVVGLIIDQMRYDYLYRYASKYSKGGFLRLRDQGFNCRNHHYQYALTVTAAGHASVYTGSVPAINGIVGNEWYSHEASRTMYCVEDTTVRTVGGTPAKSGQMSPKNLLTENSF